MNVVFFWTPTQTNGWMSNWSFHSVEEDDKKFPTTEHYLMYHKAMLMGDAHTANRILQAKTPRQVKDLGRLVKNFSEERWVAEREGIMYRALWLKTTQHKEVRDMLLATAGNVLAEASPYDRIWGIGLSKEEAVHQTEWRGLNLLGKAWMKVREVLLNSS
jgi:ribA/ribD-fused uncharacterized protein